MKYFLFVLCCFHFSFPQNNALVDDGEKLIYENKLDEAIIYYTKQLKKTTKEEQQIEVLFGLADAYRLQLNFDKSNQYYSEAYKIIKNTNNIQLEFLYHVKMAEFYRKRTMFIKSVTQLDRAAVILKKNKIENLYLAKYYNRKAALFTEHFHSQDSTLLYANKSLDLAKKLNDKDNVFYSLLEIAGVYERKKEYETSIRYLEEIIQFAKSNNMQQQEADAYISYIMALARSNQLEKALNTALYAASFSKKHKLFYNEIIFNENIQNLYFRLHNTEKAYEYLKHRLELTTKYNDIKKEELVLNLEAKYKLKEKEHEIKINNLKIANSNKELENNKVRFYIITGLFLVTILITLLVAYFLKQSNQSNKKLQILSEQNEFLLSEANHRINNNLQLIVILISDQLNKLPENEAQEIKKILKKVNSIATLHRHLYQSNDKTKVDSYKYLNDIKSSFSDLFTENNIATHFIINEIAIPTDMAMYLGLLLTELIINSIKHAFENQEYKEIKFNLKVENAVVYFNYSDNGTKLKGEGIKLKLIDKLCRQLKLEYTINTINGFSFSFQKQLN
ncbi:sensor histidine kinase [Flavobacterium jejuense]|uniref:histidine kinase n=1 Tax=Flavobacterium jejuense TaxID=1544455 RepID=A0ABX0IX25_9FLAO|nr:sensor histidine kinase [Flavobacterium jejuense]NHN28101.1 sensor histidine kinase [Flavobacterium jejuense]